MELFFPFLLIIFASIFQGSFGFGMKYMEPLKWESWWLVHVTIAMVMIPVVWAALVVPDFTAVIGEVFTNPEMSTVVYSAIFFGFLCKNISPKLDTCRFSLENTFQNTTVL